VDEKSQDATNELALQSRLSRFFYKPSFLEALKNHFLWCIYGQVILTVLIMWFLGARSFFQFPTNA